MHKAAQVSEAGHRTSFHFSSHGPLCLLAFRLCYKLRGTQRGLNSPLSLEEKAELDGKSVAQHLASVHVDKEKWSWERRVKGPFLSSRGTLPYMGVSRNRNRWMGSYGKQGEPNCCARFFRREAEAACWYDMVVMEVQGYSAMTNAQFFSVARERGWKEREEVLARRIQQRMEATGACFGHLLHRALKKDCS